MRKRKILSGKILLALLFVLCLAFVSAGCGAPAGGSVSSDAADQISSEEITADNSSTESAPDNNTSAEKAGQENGAALEAPVFTDITDGNGWDAAGLVFHWKPVKNASGYEYRIDHVWDGEKLEGEVIQTEDTSADDGFNDGGFDIICSVRAYKPDGGAAVYSDWAVRTVKADEVDKLIESFSAASEEAAAKFLESLLNGQDKVMYQDEFLKNQVNYVARCNEEESEKFYGAKYYLAAYSFTITEKDCYRADVTDKNNAVYYFMDYEDLVAYNIKQKDDVFYIYKGEAFEDNDDQCGQFSLSGKV